jgi:hypothetical protein
MQLMHQMSPAWSRGFARLLCLGGVLAQVGLATAMAQPAAVDDPSLAKDGGYVLHNFTFASGETLA